jgi:DNA repair proteins
MYPKKSIRELPKDLRPREKLSKFGASTLSDEELLAVIFGSGTKEEDVISLASKVVG